MIHINFSYDSIYYGRVVEIPLILAKWRHNWLEQNGKQKKGEAKSVFDVQHKQSPNKRFCTVLNVQKIVFG